MSKCILVVDDDAIILNILETLLGRQGFSVLTAHNASEAQKMLASSTPDLLILDVMMPGKNGYELCQWVRARPETRNIPIIMLSARSDSESVQKGHQAGADAYLAKPTLHRDLLDHVHSMLAREARLH